MVYQAAFEFQQEIGRMFGSIINGVASLDAASFNSLD
jgi:hypothetical protein